MRIAVLAALCVVAAVVACGDAQRTAALASHRSPAAMTLPLDSCERLDAQAHAQLRVFAPGESLPAPHVGSWVSTTTVDVDGLRLDVPLGVQVNPPNSEHVYALLGFPTCRFECMLTVRVTTDSSHRGLDAELAPLHTHPASSPDNEPPDPPGPPQFLTIGSERAAYMATPCGDCTSALLVAAHAGRIAHFDLTLDDQEGYQPGLLCRLARVAASAQWPTAEPR
jgi:hypothetical protein